MENEIKTMKFELNSKQLKYRDILNKEFLELEVWAISDINPNRNNSHFTKESMENFAIKQNILANCFVVCIRFCIFALNF